MPSRSVSGPLRWKIERCRGIGKVISSPVQTTVTSPRWWSGIHANVMLAKVNNKNSDTVIKALVKQSRKLPSELYKSLTWDRGSELTRHKEFTLATNIQVYFCDPKSPWQRGSNENTNGLLRQYFPKGTDLTLHSQRRLNAVARQLNERPRKTLEYETPADRFNACVASTG